MISIIICSRKTDISPLLRENISNTVGMEHEIIVIDNSKNIFSIYSAYNEGIMRSRFSFLCFVHDDVLFHTNEWGKKIISHLSDKQAGIAGVAGGKIMTEIPAQWSAVKSYMNIIRHYTKKETAINFEPAGFSGKSQSAVLLDGVFLAARREIFDAVKFDTTLNGFHGYDYDICIQATIAGYQNLVIYDVLLEHFAKDNGNINALFYRNLIYIYRKWENYLPLFTADTEPEIKTQISKTENLRLAKLLRRMARTGFTTDEIIDTANYYAKILNAGEAKKILRFLKLKICFERIFNSK